MKKFLSFMFFIVLSKVGYAQDVIRVGIDTVYPPFEFLKDNKVVGFDADFAKALFDKLGMKYELVPTAYEDICPNIKAGKLDIGISALGDDEYTKDCEFSEPYFVSKNVFIKREDKPYASKEDLNKTKIGFIESEMMRKIVAGIPGAKPIQREEISGLILSLKAGKIDAILADSAMASNITSEDFSNFSASAKKQYKMLKSMGMDKPLKVFYSEESSEANTMVGLPKDRLKELKPKINKAIEDLKADKTLEGLMKKYNL